MNLTINIIGAGHWGPNLIRNFTRISGVRIGKVADLSEARLAQVRARFPSVATTSNSAEVTQDPSADAVAIVTPVSTHFDLARQALRAGKHVFVEKPLCSTVAQCEELIDLAESANRVLMVGHVFLFNPGILKIKQILETGALGRIFYIDAVRTNLGPVRTDVNALWDLAAHDLSVMDFLLREPAHSVSATGCRVGEGMYEDVMFATVQYRNGVTAHFHASWLNPRKVRQITIVGEKKMLVWDDIDLTRAVQIYDHSFTVTSPNSYTDSFGSHRLQCFQGDLVIPRVGGEEPLMEECNHFVDCIVSGAECRTNGRTGLDVVRVLAAADRSLKSRGAEMMIDLR
jgi:predicted dehydrogenase